MAVRVIRTRATKLLSVSEFVVAAVDVLAFVVAVASRDLASDSSADCETHCAIKIFLILQADRGFAKSG